MNWFQKLAKFIGEDPKDIRRRLDRAQRLLPVSVDRVLALKSQLAENTNISDRIFTFVTFYPSAGERDFEKVLHRYGLRVYKTVRIDRRRYGTDALYEALRSCRSDYRPGDIVCVIRGGGDTADPQFEPYRSKKAAEYLIRLEKEKSLITISGLGHADDKFEIDRAVLYAMLTPTDAANQAGSIINGSLTI